MNKNKIIIILLAILAVLIIFNQFQILSLSKLDSATGLATGVAQVSALDILPKGIPEVYGKELGVSYDDVNINTQQKADATIRKLGQLDTSLNLDGDLLKRYIKITNSISCEYCCGAQAITFPDGEAACGCAHSFAMRGLAKYLLKEHSQMSDDAILEELGKWKTLFFPEILKSKASVLKEKGIEFNYINLASNKYRGIEQGNAQGNMVGGC